MTNHPRSLRTLGILSAWGVFGTLVILLVNGCGRGGDAVDSFVTNSAWFEDVTEKVGLRFQHEAGPLPVDDHYFMPQLVGSGASMFDMTNAAAAPITLHHTPCPSRPH